MARISSGSAVTVLTAAAMAVVCVFAYQAAGSTPEKRAATGRHATASPTPSGKPSGDRPVKATPVPDDSGEGKRVVYALAGKRVWLVDEREQVVRSYPVAPSSVSPPPGKYKVTVRNGNITGSDGVPIEHVVVFGSFSGTVIGFSSAVEASAPLPDPDSPKRTGGIRQSRADGDAMWEFATIGVPVVVVP